MRLLFWRGRIPKKDFRDRFCKALRMALPAARVEATHEDLGVKVSELPDVQELNVWLGRAYDEFVKNPSGADAIIARWVSSVASSASTTLDPDRVVPTVKSHQWLADQQKALGSDRKPGAFDLWAEPYNSELALVYAEWRDGLHFTARSNFEALGIPLAELRERALVNLRRTVKEPRERIVTKGDGFYLIGAGGTLDASLLLLDDVLDDPRIELRDEPLIGVPDRDTFAVADAADANAVFRFAASVAHLYKSEPYPISRQLFFKKGGVYQPLDTPRADDSHPVPNLDVIDVHAAKKSGGSRLVLVIASPLQADARSIFRLHSKLDGYLDFIGSTSYRQEHGAPTPQTTSIEVSLHAGADPEVLELLSNLGDWVAQRGAAFRVEQR